MADVNGASRYALLEAARRLWQARAGDAVALLEGLAKRLPPAFALVWLRYLAMGHQMAGRTEQAFCRADEARRAAHLAGDVEEAIRAKAVLGRIHAHASAPNP